MSEPVEGVRKSRRLLSISAAGPENSPSDHRLARSLRGFGLLAIVVIVLGNVLFVPLSAILVLV
jgi:hypothetical protein